jgi:anthranilate synthase component II
MLLLIDNYDSFTCNIATAFNLLGEEVVIKKNDELSLDEVSSFSPNYLVIGPGPKKPKDAGFSISLIKKFSDKLPILGICLGHQAIGEVFGSKTIRSKTPSHGKLEIIFHEERGIFQGIKKEFLAIRYNSLVIDGIPSSSPLEITALNKDGEIMGVKHKFFPIEGVQFHPESIFSEEGEKLLKNFLKSKRISDYPRSV